MTPGFRPSAMPGTPLSRMETRVLAELVRDGASNKVIARRMYLSEACVKGHLSDAMRCAGVSNRTALALWWLRTLDGRDGT